MRRLTPVLLLGSLAALPAFSQKFALRQIATGIPSPVAIAHASDSRLFVVLQRGEIWIYDGTRVLPVPFLDIRLLVSCCNERGLLGLAFHPKYSENGRFFVYYTNRSGDIVVARYNVSADPDRADPASRVEILQIAHPSFANHNGGQLQFGPDGYLYLGTGDGGSGGDPMNNSQNVNVLLGKLLRLDVDSAPYAIPPSNPFVGRANARPEIWAYGLRNPWRFSFDRDTGELWIADVGQDTWEEIDLQAAGSAGGANYGWRAMEGTHCFNPSRDCRQPDMILPIIEYDHSGGACSVTGGYRYRGSRYPRYRGTYFYADYCIGVISAATQQPNGSWNTRQLFDTRFAISTFGEDIDGEIYVADYAGTIYQITDATPLPPKRRGARF
jgi:glucose/arabinose dehydrogenase